MADKDWWTMFERTGSIVDYLHYKGIRVGEDESESGSYSDRVDTVGDTDWRVR